MMDKAAKHPKIAHGILWFIFMITAGFFAEGLLREIYATGGIFAVSIFAGTFLFAWCVLMLPEFFLAAGLSFIFTRYFPELLVLIALIPDSDHVFDFTILLYGWGFYVLSSAVFSVLFATLYPAYALERHLARRASAKAAKEKK